MTEQTLPVVETEDATLVPIVDVKHFIIDADGNRVEVSEDVTFVQNEGEVATEVAAD